MQANECYATFSGPFITALQIMEGVWQSVNRNIICAIVRGRIKGAGVLIYAIWHCPLGLPRANM